VDDTCFHKISGMININVSPLEQMTKLSSQLGKTEMKNTEYLTQKSHATATFEVFLSIVSIIPHTELGIYLSHNQINIRLYQNGSSIPANAKQGAVIWSYPVWQYLESKLDLFHTPINLHMYFYEQHSHILASRSKSQLLLPHHQTSRFSMNSMFLKWDSILHEGSKILSLRYWGVSFTQL
jgi:hypothetical protein